MFDALGPGTILGYCTNVHPGGTLSELEHSLRTHSTRVRDLVCPGGDLPVGLWLSARALADASSPEGHSKFREFLRDLRLVPYTFNGFPIDDFQHIGGCVIEFQPGFQLIGKKGEAA